VREGFETLEEADELEEDYLDKAWGVDPDSRLSCQALVAEADLVVELPKYTINMVSERH
jgi:2Fe-2S ferredoxin